MKKSIIAGILLGLGVILTGLGVAYIIARISSDLSWSTVLYELSVGGGLRENLRHVAVGLALILAAIILFLLPRRRKAHAPTDADGFPDRTEHTVLDSRNGNHGAPAPVAPLRTYHARVMGTTFVSGKAHDRQAVIGSLTVGDMVLCRTHTMEDGRETVGLYTVGGDSIGFLDAAVLRDIRETYAHHQIGVQIERIDGGHGLPYTCRVAVTVYG